MQIKQNCMLKYDLHQQIHQQYLNINLNYLKKNIIIIKFPTVTRMIDNDSNNYQK